MRGEEPLILDRSQAYIGVLIDDLVTRGTREPYRLFTSRAEYRLLLREDNADLRLRDIGRALGLVDDATFAAFEAKRAGIAAGVAWLEATVLKPTAEVNARLRAMGRAELKQPASLADLLRRPEMAFADLAGVAGRTIEVAEAVREPVQLAVKYEGYIRRQEEQVERFRRLEEVRLPEEMEYAGLAGLSNEVVEKLGRVRPRSLGQASRISGITPAAISVLQVHLKKAGLL